MSMVTVMLITIFVLMIASVIDYTAERQNVYSSSAIESLLNLTQSQNETEESGTESIIVLSSKYTNKESGDEIIGEVLNNGSGTAEFVKISISFYDQNHQIIDYASTYADPSKIEPGKRSPFVVFISSDSPIERQMAASYEIIVQWLDLGSSLDHSRRYT